MDEVIRFQRRYEREKKSRQQAEDLLEAKSRELYEVNLSLAAFAASLEDQVAERTRELNLAKDEAIKSNRAKSDFLANMSHEIRTPMNGVLGMMSVLEGTPLNDEQKKYLEAAINAGETLLVIINDILDLSKIESHKLELESIEFNLHDTIEEIVNIFTHATQEKSLEIFSLINANLPSVLMGDPTRIRQIITNLVSNAIKFTGEGGILIKSSYENKQLIIKVTDTGIGMTPDQLDVIWQAFNQADTATTRKYGGTGLGLSICRELSHLMDGDITAHSELNKGTTFTLSLPLDQASNKSLTFVSPHPASKNSCLIADSSSVLSKALSTQLTEWGFACVDECDVNILPTLQRSTEQGSVYNFILLDLTLKENYAGDLIKNIHTLPSYKNVKIICTGNTSLTELMSVDAVVKTPVNLKELYFSIQRVYNPSTAFNNLSNSRTRSQQVRKFVSTKVMVVDDSETNLIVARVILERLGLSVITCADGKDALHKVTTEEDIALILMDLQMPLMDGFEATTAIRAMPEPYRSLPIIALTATALTGDREKSLAAGLNEHLAKPIEQENLIKVLSMWLEPCDEA